MSTLHRLRGGNGRRGAGRGGRASDDIVTRRELDPKIEAVLQTMRADSAVVRAEFTAAVAEIKVEVRTLAAEIRGEMREQNAQLRAEMKEQIAKLDGDVKELRGEVKGILDAMSTMKWAMMLGLGLLGLLPQLVPLLTAWKVAIAPVPVTSAIPMPPPRAASAPGFHVPADAS